MSPYAAKLFPTLFLNPTRPDNPPPSFISFSTRNDTVSVNNNELGEATSFYELLGIPDNTVSIMEIKQAYKQLARKYHPDVSPPDRVEEYTNKFIRVQEAYETLSDTRRRELYDLQIQNGFTSPRFNKQTGDKNEWKNRWQSQVSDLKKRSMYKESTDNMSWAARMRMERNKSSSSSS